MKKLNLILSITAMLIFGATAFAAAPQDAQSSQQPSAQSKTGHGHGAGEGQGRGMGMNPDAMLEHMSKELNLTDDQKTKIKPILEDMQKKMGDLRKDTSLAQEDRRAKMKEIRDGVSAKFKEILTAEQFAKWEKMGPGNRRPGAGAPPPAAPAGGDKAKN